MPNDGERLRARVESHAALQSLHPVTTPSVHKAGMAAHPWLPPCRDCVASTRGVGVARNTDGHVEPLVGVAVARIVVVGPQPYVPNPRRPLAIRIHLSGGRLR